MIYSFSYSYDLFLFIRISRKKYYNVNTKRSNSSNGSRDDCYAHVSFWINILRMNINSIIASREKITLQTSNWRKKIIKHLSVATCNIEKLVADVCSINNSTFILNWQASVIKKNNIPWDLKSDPKKVNLINIQFKSKYKLYRVSRDSWRHRRHEMSNQFKTCKSSNT